MPHPECGQAGRVVPIMWGTCPFLHYLLQSPGKRYSLTADWPI